jgi:hypothetical protein
MKDESTMTARAKAPTLEELEQRAQESRIPGVVFVSDEEWFAMFDEADWVTSARE